MHPSAEEISQTYCFRAAKTVFDTILRKNKNQQYNYAPGLGKGERNGRNGCQLVLYVCFCGSIYRDAVKVQQQQDSNHETTANQSTPRAASISIATSGHIECLLSRQLWQSVYLSRAHVPAAVTVLRGYGRYFTVQIINIFIA